MSVRGLLRLRPVALEKLPDFEEIQRVRQPSQVL